MALSRMSYARLAVLGVSALVFVAATALAGLLFGHAAFSSADVTSGPASPAPSPIMSPGDGAGGSGADMEFVEFRDPEAGFTLSYPAIWGPRSSEDPEVRFLASSPDGQNSALVRVTPFDREKALRQLREQVDQEVTPLDLNVRVTQQRIRSGENVQKVLLGPKIVEFAGRRASYYVYTFGAADGDQQGVHAQYFLFEQDRMITLVLQAIPPGEFTRLAGAFDRIAQSFELLPQEGSSESTGAGS